MTPQEEDEPQTFTAEISMGDVPDEAVIDEYLRRFPSSPQEDIETLLDGEPTVPLPLALLLRLRGWLDDQIERAKAT